MRELRLSCPPGSLPPAEWIAGETISYQDTWWFIHEMHYDTQRNSGWHFTLLETIPKSQVIQTFATADDPGWAENEVVLAPNKQSMIVTESTRTTGLITYYGVKVPPPDPPKIAEIFG